MSWQQLHGTTVPVQDGTGMEICTNCYMHAHEPYPFCIIIATRRKMAVFEVMEVVLCYLIVVFYIALNAVPVVFWSFGILWYLDRIIRQANYRDVRTEVRLGMAVYTLYAYLYARAGCLPAVVRPQYQSAQYVAAEGTRGEGGGAVVRA